VVERDGQAQVVVLSKQAFDQLVAGSTQQGWRELLAEAHRHVRVDTTTYKLTAPEQVLNELREERDEQFDDLH
jgi:hypothetical protein